MQVPLILCVVIAVLAAVISAVAFFFVGARFRKKVAEREIGRAEDQAKKILAEDEDEVSTSSSLIPVSKAGKTATRKDKGVEKKDPDRPKTYVVQEGDDMTGVSIRWGVSAAEIRELNNLGEGDQLVPGQIIKLPADAQQ